MHQLERQLHSRHPQKQLNQQKAQIQQQRYDLQLAMQRYLTKTQQNLTALCERLNNNPLPYQMQKHSQHLQQLQVRLDFAIEKNSAKNKTTSPNSANA